ncbi:MAG: TrkH family potassium uptake protein [Calothrix sp. C42_A2020_038]|nr:TrkH family potassium uptake protein [Calothrix sp. C42_A2020_038]
MALVSLPVCLWFREYYVIWAFLITAIASLLSGQLLYRNFDETGQARLRHAMIIAAVSWGIIPFFGAIPFWVVAFELGNSAQTPQTVQEFQNFWNALFESASGFTSTGLTVTLNESELPYSLQWWRSFMEWIGGVGVIVLVLSVLEPSTDSYQLYCAEGRSKRIASTVSATVRRIWWIYLLYTGFSILLLRITGMSWWDGINHGLTSISTGGFSIRDDSIASYSPVIQLAVILVMTLGAISFPIHYELITYRRLSALWKDSQHKTLWLLLALGTIALIWENLWFFGSFLWLDSLFQWVSALGTCGFETVDLQSWSPSAKLLMSLGMIVGGAAGSTVGGLKIQRLVSLGKAVVWQFQKLALQPDELMHYKIEGEIVTEVEANQKIAATTALLVLWVSAIALGVVFLLHVAPDYSLIDVIFEVTSALGSVGLSVGITNPDLYWSGKLTLIVLMWLGRLEIIPVLVLFLSLVNGKRRT